MARAEEVRLLYSDVEVSSICNGHTRAFQDLKRLFIKKCHKMGHLASKSQDEIQYSSLQSPTCFSKLTNLHIQRCSKLKYLFCNNIAKSLVQLQQLRVEDCSSMEAIIMNEGTSDGEIINFSKLTYLNIQGCSKLKYLFCNNIAKSLVQLKQLTVIGCESMEAIIMNEGTSDGEIINFSKLKSLTIFRLPRLTSFHGEKENMHSGLTSPVDNSAQYQPLFDGKVAFPSLEELEITELPYTSVIWGKDCFIDSAVLSIVVTNSSVLESFFHGANFEFNMPALRDVTIAGCGLSILFTCSVFREIRQLERLYVSNCELLERIVEEVESDETSEINGKSITSSQLSSITLQSLPNLKSFSCTSSYVFNMPKLKEFRLIKCPRIEYFSSSKTNTSLVRVITSGWCSEEGIQDLNDFIRQNHKRGSYLSEHAGESSDLGTQSERIDEEKSQKTETV